MTSDAVPTSSPDPTSGPDPALGPDPASGPVPRASTPPRTPSAPPAPAAAPAPAAGRHALRTRTGYTWVGLVAAALIGIITLIFILQNLGQVRVTLFFWTFSLPLGVTVLLSAIAGALVMSLVGGWRIIQLRRAARRP